jgi:hypothetical protein
MRDVVALGFFSLSNNGHSQAYAFVTNERVRGCGYEQESVVLTQSAKRTTGQIVHLVTHDGSSLVPYFGLRAV